MADVLDVDARIRVPVDEFDWSFARSSGAGGQNVNRTNSKAILRWRPLESPSLPVDVRARFASAFPSRLTLSGDLIVSSETHRDQPRNVAECLEKVRAMLLQVARPPKARKKTRPTAGSKRRRLDSKRADSDKKRSRSPKHWD